MTQKKILKAIAILFFGIAGVAKANVTLEPITWNVIGLDSNKPDTVQPNPEVFPPDRYPVGVEVCNTSTTDTESDLKTVFVWDETPVPSYIELWNSTGTGNAEVFRELTVPQLAPGQCEDVYYFVRVDRVAAAYGFTRDYYIEVWDDDSPNDTATNGTKLTSETPQPRELYIEYLVSQNRNAVLGYSVDGVSVAPGGSVAVKPGDTIELVIDAKTATQGYEQLEVFIALPPDLFTINSVRTTYSANSGTDSGAGQRLYADGCGWENDPTSPNYHNNNSCAGTGKYGGSIQQTLSITVSPSFASDVVGQTLIYDFSGSSYHYNADYEGGDLRFTVDNAPIVSTGDLSIFKSADTQAQDEFFLTITNEGSNTFPQGPLGFVVEDELPAGYETKSGNAAQQISLEEFDSLGTLKVTQDYATDIAPQVEFYNLSANQVGGPDQADGPDYDSGERHIIWTPNLKNELAPGDSAKFTFQVAPVSGAVGEDIYTNCAEIVTADDDSSNNRSCATLPPPNYDLGVTKAVLSIIGDTANFEVSVTNNGPDSSVQTLLEDVVPLGYSGVSSVSMTGDVPMSLSPRADINAGILLLEVPIMSSGQTATLSYSVSILDPVGNETTQAQLDERYLNIARILDASSEPNNGTYDPVTDRVSLLDADTTNNAASASATPTLLTIEKSPDDGTITGTTFTYGLTVAKVGVFLAGDVITLVEAPPPGMTITAMSGTGWDCSAAPTVPTDEDKTCTRIVAGGDADTYPAITVDVELDPIPNGAATYVNTSFVEATRGGNTLFNTFDSDSVQASTLEADLSLAKTVSDANPNVGDTLTFTLELTNDGPDTATNVEVTDIVPTGYTYVASSIAGGTSWDDANPSGSGLVWTMASINSGSSETLTFNATVNAAGDYENSAQVTASDQPDPDSTPSNDTPSEDDQDSASTTPTPVIDLSVSKSAASEAVGQNTDASFTIRVSNAGPSNATGVDIVDTLPAGLTYVTGSVSGSGVLVTNELRWSGLSIPAGDFVELTYDATVAAGMHTNFVEVAAANEGDIDSTPGNGDGSTPGEDDEATETVEGTSTFVAAPALTLEKAVTSGDPYAQVGEVVSYSYTVTNSGNVALAGPVAVADDKIVSVSCPAVSTVGNNDGNLDPSEAVVCTGDYTVTQADLDAGSVTNTASASADGTTSNEDTATATAAITAAIEGVVFEETSAGYDGLLTSELLTNGGGLYVCLDTNPARFAQVGSVTTGAFEFRGLQPGASYNLVLTTENGGSTCPVTSTLNTNWYSTGESEDGVVTDSVVIPGETLSDGKLAVTVPQVTRSPSVLGVTAVTFGLARASVFDPPFGLKTGEFLEGQPVIRWTMVWINDSPIPVTGAVITDPPPTGTTYVDGSVSCEGRGTTTHSVCTFDSMAGQLQVVADFGPETGSPVDENTADNELIIRFDVTYDAVNPEPEYLNQGTLQWNDGSGNPTATTDDPTVTGDNDPSVVVPVIAPVIPVPSLPLPVLGLMILCIGWYGTWRSRLV